jgi:DNA-binding response OmpR family regulator
VAFILVVDDDAGLAELTELVLVKAGHRVRKAFSGREALAALGVEPEGDCEAELVLLDQRLPDMDGREVLRRLRAAGRSLPVILLTGDSGAADEPDLPRLKKPFDPRRVLELISELTR